MHVQKISDTCVIRTWQTTDPQPLTMMKVCYWSWWHGEGRQAGFARKGLHDLTRWHTLAQRLLPVIKIWPWLGLWIYRLLA
jgi:hypothetical protein